MKIFVTGTIVSDPTEGYVFPFVIGQGPNMRVVRLSVDASAKFDPNSAEPFKWDGMGNGNDGIWFFRNHAVSVEGSQSVPEHEVKVRIKHAVLREEKAFARMTREIEAFENLEKLPDARRERNPDSVRLFVWQRDEGKCVRCGTAQNLEFDHIIPIAKAGANTERNIQLLCEVCNRAKGVSI